MFNDHKYEKITALIDGELHDRAEREILLQDLEVDNELRFEYHVQKSMKDLLVSRFARRKAPEYLRDSILIKISSELSSTSPHRRHSSVWENIFNPKFALGFAFGIILLAVVFNVSNSSPETLAEQQKGANNFYLQALANYDKIEKGDLKPQFASSDPGIIRQFFSDNGVNYETNVENKKYWDLAGAVVSEEKGVKFAHHIYSDDKGHIVYVFQTDLNHCGKEGALVLSEDLLDFLENESLVLIDNGKLSALWKRGHNYFALVSNDERFKIEESFLTTN